MKKITVNFVTLHKRSGDLFAIVLAVNRNCKFKFAFNFESVYFVTIIKTKQLEQ